MGETRVSPSGEFVAPTLGAAELLVAAAIVGVVVALALAFGLVGSVMEFVFVQSLRNEDVRVREYWGAHWRQGLRLFAFRLVLFGFVFGSIAILAIPFLVGMFDVANVTGGFVIAFLLVLLPVFLVLALTVGIVNGFTTVFVAPIMLLEDCGVLDGWRELWPTIKREPLQYLAYAVASFFLGIVGGVLVVVVTGVFALVPLVPFGVLFAIGGVIFAVGLEGVGIAVLVVVGLVFALAAIAVAALVQMPVQTYLRYYAMFVLGDVDASLDAVPDQRAAVREPEPSESTPT